MRVPAPVDRSACPATRHGTEAAYRYGCRCADAVEDARVKKKRRREGRSLPAYVDSTGTMRRLQALAVMGWSSQDLVAFYENKTDKAIRSLRSGDFPFVRRVTAEETAVIYDKLSVQVNDNPRARGWARRFRWAHPWSWDEDTIDDPNAKPLRQRQWRRSIDGHVRRLDPEEIAGLVEGGRSIKRIAAELGFAESSIKELLAAHRAGQSSTRPKRDTPQDDQRDEETAA